MPRQYSSQYTGAVTITTASKVDTRSPLLAKRGGAGWVRGAARALLSCLPPCACVPWSPSQGGVGSPAEGFPAGLVADTRAPAGSRKDEVGAPGCA